ncbi:FxSxx-COOH system tetratricopeptide repeat protein [Nonomuraea sp. NPDC050790]|uniref:FxSxx-COOH system tetratricopeptide repeat protein n=1 Tax=Nonomuraea sp. NPDC050790 TaxID=3364371 RepID=UPI0037B261B0
MSGNIEINMLGSFEVLADGRPITIGRGQRAALMAILALNAGQVVSTGRLVEDLWTGAPPPSAQNALHAQLSRLRRLLHQAGADPGVVRSRSSGYQLEVDLQRIDACRFEQLVNQSRGAVDQGEWERAVTLLDQALGLWRGAALGEFAGESWAQCDIIRLEELRHAAEESKADAELKMGRFAEIVPRLEHRVALHPFRERAAAQLMTALYRSGQRAESLAVYERVRTILADELGVDPAPGLQRLHLVILNQEVETYTGRIDNLPARNPVFRGREDVLAEVRAVLTGPPARPVAVYGLSGVGKTQIALEYAHRWAHAYQVRWRASAADPVVLDGSLAELAVRLGVPRRADRKEIMRALAQRLADVEAWLMILEDADEGDGLADALFDRAGNGHVIVTSRSPAWARWAVPLYVAPFSREESTDFLARRLAHKVEADEAAALAEQLGDLPAALEQAAAYVEQAGMTLGEYGVLFGRRARTLLARRAGADRYAPAWDLAFERITRESAAAGELLHLCAILSAEGTSLSLLRRSPEALPPALGAAVVDEIGLEDAIAHLLHHSLISRDRGRLRMHRLVQVAARGTLDDESRRAWLAHGIRLIGSATPQDSDNPAAWQDWDEAIPHLVGLVDQMGKADPVPEGMPRLLSMAGRYLATRAVFAAAKEAQEEALALARRADGLEQEDLIAILVEYGRFMELVGDLPRARAIQEEALARAEESLGRDHPRTALALISLADVLMCERELPDARRLLERALTILRSRSDRYQREISKAVRDLGFVAWAAGDLATAATWISQALTEARRLLGPAHPDVAHALSLLGLVRQDEGDAARAVLLQEQAAAILTAVHGDTHPDVAHAYDKRGYALRLLARLDEAEASHTRALNILESVYGPAHGEVGMPLSNLGLVFHDRGDAPAAARSQERAREVFTGAFGADSPHAHLALRRLGMARCLAGATGEGIRLLTAARTGIERRLGPTHPDVGRTLLELAKAHEILLDHAAADACRTRAREILRASYGEPAADLIERQT